MVDCIFLPPLRKSGIARKDLGGGQHAERIVLEQLTRIAWAVGVLTLNLCC
jgi:hypothetical protein